MLDVAVLGVPVGAKDVADHAHSGLPLLLPLHGERLHPLGGHAAMARHREQPVHLGERYVDLDAAGVLRQEAASANS